MKQETSNRAWFQEWIRAYGVRRLARDLGLDATAVSKWANGKSQPSLPHAIQVLKLAEGKLRAKDLVLKKGGAR